MNRKLYFITAISLNRDYDYVYILADSRSEAIELFKKQFISLEIVSIKALYPSKRNIEKINMYISNKSRKIKI